MGFGVGRGRMVEEVLWLVMCVLSFRVLGIFSVFCFIVSECLKEGRGMVLSLLGLYFYLFIIFVF